MNGKKAYRIDVFQFEKGNSGRFNACGFIFRHGELQIISVPVSSGSATARMEPREALVVKASGAERVFYPVVRFGGEGLTFQLNLMASDRMPSGLQIDCPYCKTKGYLSA